MSNSDLKLISAHEMTLSHGDMFIKESQELIQHRVNDSDNGKYDPLLFYLFKTSISCIQDIAQLLPSNPEEHRYSPACYFCIREVTDNFIDYFYLLANPQHYEMKSDHLKRNIDCPNEHAENNWTKDLKINRYDRYLQGFWKYEETLEPLLYREKFTAENRKKELKSFIAFISKMGHTDYAKFGKIDSYSFLSNCYYNVLYMSACMLNIEYKKAYNKPPDSAYMANINFPLNLFQPEFIESLKPETT